MLRWIEMVGIFMSAENVDSVPADAQARSGKQGLIDRVAHRSVGRARAFRAHVALRGEPGHKIVTRSQNCSDRPLRHRLFHCLQVFRAGMQKQMHVSINQSGQQSTVAQIDNFCAWGVGHPGSYFGNPLTLHQHFAGSQDVAAPDLKETRRMQHDSVR